MMAHADWIRLLPDQPSQRDSVASNLARRIMSIVSALLLDLQSAAR
jgi:hypothetical protein